MNAIGLEIKQGKGKRVNNKGQGLSCIEVTSIKFFLSVPEHVRLDIYNTKGNKVSTLINKKMAAGEHVIDFDGEGLPGGGVFLQINCR